MVKKVLAFFVAVLLSVNSMGSLRFDTSTEELNETTGLPGITSFTMMAWVQVVTTASLEAFLSYGASASTSYYELIYNGDASPNLQIWNGSTSVDGPSAMTTGVWYHVAITVAGTGAGQCLGYLNGTLEVTQAGFASNTNTKMTVARATDASDPLNGRAACVKVYSAVLTAAEIQNEMYHCRPVRSENLNKWTPAFNVGEQNFDYSGLANNWTVGGTLSTEDGPPIGW